MWNHRLDRLEPRPRRAAQHPRTHDPYPGPARAGRRRPVAVAARAARPSAPGDHRPGERCSTDACRGGRAGGADLQRRGLQLPRAARRAGDAGPGLPHPLGHRSGAARLSAMGRGFLRPAPRHLRLRPVGRARAEPVAGARSLRGQAAVLLPDRRRRAVRLGTQGDLRQPRGQPGARRQRHRRAVRPDHRADSRPRPVQGPAPGPAGPGAALRPQWCARVGLLGAARGTSRRGCRGQRRTRRPVAPRGSGRATGGRRPAGQPAFRWARLQRHQRLRGGRAGWRRAAPADLLRGLPRRRPRLRPDALAKQLGRTLCAAGGELPRYAAPYRAGRPGRGAGTGRGGAPGPRPARLGRAGRLALPAVPPGPRAHRGWMARMPPSDASARSPTWR